MSTLIAIGAGIAVLAGIGAESVLVSLLLKLQKLLQDSRKLKVKLTKILLLVRLLQWQPLFMVSLLHC